MTRQACFAIAATLAISACQSDVSGKYLAKYSDGICWLQLVRTPDNHVTAQIETDQLRSDGKIDRNAAALEGAVDGNNVALSARAFGLQVVTLAGSIQGGKLTLTGLQAEPLVLVRSDMAEYQSELKKLNSRSQQIAEDAIVTKFSRSAFETARRAEVWASDTHLHIQRLPSVEDRYRQIEDRMNLLIQKERVTQNAVTRGQISVAVNQLDVAATQLDVQATPVWNQVRAGGSELSRSFAVFARDCAADRESDLTEKSASPAAIEEWRKACTRVLAEKSAFEPTLRDATEKRAELASFLRDADRRRQALVEQSNRLE